MKPILFNTAMVKAILEGRKTTTRRIIKNVGNRELLEHDGEYYKFGYSSKAVVGTIYEAIHWCKPKFNVGDILYVRETWKQYEKRIGRGSKCHLEKFYGYKADESNPKNPSEFYDGNWKPSIHMPKVAARIFLKVTDVRVEKLKHIKAGQCIKEGINLGYKIQSSYDASEYIKAFADLWDTTTKEYKWRLNPWVWVISFEQCEKPNE